MSPRAAAGTAGALGVAAGAVAAARLVTVPQRRRWSSPAGTMHAWTLMTRRLGREGPPLILLHGICGSHRSWGRAFDALAERAQLVVPDLLGFGESPKPATGYTVEDHVAAVAAVLGEAGLGRPAVVAGHSMGALVAVGLARLRPELVDRVVALAPPVYRDRASARRHVRAMGPVERIMAFDPPARRLCGVMCAHRRAAARLAVLARPDLPAPLARDAVQHTWASYSLNMERLILSGFAVAALEEVRRPVAVVVAADDAAPDTALLGEIAARNPAVELTVWPSGGHDLPLSRPEECVALIRQALTRPSAVAP